MANLTVSATVDTFMQASTASAARTAIGLFDETAKLGVHGADIASAGTTNLETATGELVDVTGTTTITAITLNDGHRRTVRFTGILTLTHGASLVLPGAANIITAAGDIAVLQGYAAGVVRCVGYMLAAVAPFNPAAPGAIGGTTPAAGAFTTLSTTLNLTLGGLLVGSKQSVSGSGAVTAPNLTTLTTIYTGTVGADLTATLPSGTVDGQIKIISCYLLEGAQLLTITTTMADGNTSIEFAHGNSSVMLQWDSSNSVWNALSYTSAVTIL